MGQQAIELDPLLPAGFYNLGSFRYYPGRLNEAGAALVKALELPQQYPVAHAWLGRVFLAESKQQDAVEAIQMESDSPWLFHGRPVLHHALGKMQEADVALAKLIKEMPGPFGVLNRRGICVSGGEPTARLSARARNETRRWGSLRDEGQPSGAECRDGPARRYAHEKNTVALKR